MPCIKIFPEDLKEDYVGYSARCEDFIHGGKNYSLLQVRTLGMTAVHIEQESQPSFLVFPSPSQLQ
jgi:hypothetical protein